MRKIFSLEGILFILSIIFTLIIFYKSEIQFEGKRRDYYLVYLIISLVVTFFSIILYFLKNQFKTYVAIIMCFSIFTFYLFEFYLTIKFNNNLELINKKIASNKLTNKYNYKNKKKSYNFAISPKTFLNFENDFFYLTGLSNTTSKVCNENGYFSIVNSDKFGFNNPENIWKNENFDYVLIGDSFIYGNCVNRPYDISSVIRKKTHKKVINFGIQGNGPLAEYAILREYLNFRSKKILWFFFEGNDLEDLENELNNQVLKKYIEDKKFYQNLINRQTEIDKFYKKYLKKAFLNTDQNKQTLIEENNFSKLIRFFKLYNLRIALGIDYKQKYKYKEFFQIIDLINELAIENKSQLYFIYLPSFYRYNGNIHAHYHFKNINKKIRNFTDKNDIVFIDIDELIFDKETNLNELFASNENSHYSKKGYKKIAELIVRLTQ